MASTLYGFDPATYNKSTLEYTLGEVYTYAANGNRYRFVQVVTAAGADGVVFIRSGASPGIVIGSNRGGVAGTGCGVGVGLITINFYGFILAGGTHTNVMCNGSTAGVMQVAAGTNDSCADAVAATISQSIGVALTTTAGVGRVTVDVRCG